MAYLEEQERKQHAVKAKEQRSAIESCRLCDEKGWRRISTPKYPDGALKRCTHDADIEAKYQDARL